MSFLSPEALKQVQESANPFDEEFGIPTLPDQNPTDDLPDNHPASEDGERVVHVPAHTRRVPNKREPRFVQEIDPGDGSPKQVFKADTQEELLEKLTEAQRNASRRINELKRNLVLGGKKPELTKKTPITPAQPVQLSADEEFLLGQDLTRNPVQAFDKLFKVTTGMSLAEYREKAAVVDNLNALVVAQNEAQSWLTSHAQDFHPSPKNLQTMQQYLDKEGLATTKDNLEYAFKELTSNELLDTPPDPDQGQHQPANGAINSDPVTPEPRKRVSTGLSGRSSARQNAPKSGLPTADEIMSLPLDDARDLLNQAFYAAKQGQSF